MSPLLGFGLIQPLGPGCQIFSFAVAACGKQAAAALSTWRRRIHAISGAEAAGSSQQQPCSTSENSYSRSSSCMCTDAPSIDNPFSTPHSGGGSSSRFQHLPVFQQQLSGSLWPSQQQHSQRYHHHHHHQQQWRTYRGAAKRARYPLPGELQAAFQEASARPARAAAPPLVARPLMFSSRRAGAIAIKAGMTQVGWSWG